MHDAIVFFVVGAFSFEGVDVDIFILSEIVEHGFTLLFLDGFFIKDDVNLHTSCGGFFNAFGNLLVGKVVDRDMNALFGKIYLFV